MAAFFTAVALFLLTTTLGGLVRVSLGPASADRMLAAQLMASAGIAMLLLLAEAMDQPALRNVALVFALLAVLTVVAFAERPAREESGEP